MLNSSSYRLTSSGMKMYSSDKYCLKSFKDLMNLIFFENFELKKNKIGTNKY